MTALHSFAERLFIAACAKAYVEIDEMPGCLSRERRLAFGRLVAVLDACGQDAVYAIDAARETRDECSCFMCEGSPVPRLRMYVCADCGSRRCPRAEDHRAACAKLRGDR